MFSLDADEPKLPYALIRHRALRVASNQGLRYLSRNKVPFSDDVIYIWSQIIINRLKSKILHPWSETVRFSLKESRQTSYEECILILLPYSRDYEKKRPTKSE